MLSGSKTALFGQSVKKKKSLCIKCRCWFLSLFAYILVKEKLETGRIIWINSFFFSKRNRILSVKKMKVQYGQKMRVLPLLMETIWTWKFCVTIYLAKSQGEIKCNLALISAGKKTLKWLLIYHCAHPPPLPPWFNWQCNTELFVSSLDCWKWNQPRWRERSKLSGLARKEIVRKKVQ